MPIDLQQLQIQRQNIPQVRSRNRQVQQMQLPNVMDAAAQGQALGAQQGARQMQSVTQGMQLANQLQAQDAARKKDTADREQRLTTTMAGVYQQLKTKPKDEQRRILGTWLDTQRNNPQFADLIDDDDYQQMDNQWDAMTAHFDSVAGVGTQKKSRGAVKYAQVYRNRNTGETVSTAIIDGVLTNTETGRPFEGNLDEYDTLDVSEAGSKAEQAERAKIRTQVVRDFKDTARVASEQKAQVRLLKQIGKTADLGIEGKLALKMRKFGDFLGFDVDDAKIASGEAVNQLSTKMSLSLTQLTKGSISDREMGLFLEAVPGLTSSDEGFNLMADIIEAGADRSIAMSKYASKLIRANNNRIPDDLQERVIDHFRDKPLIPLSKLDTLLGVDVPKGIPAGARQIGTAGGKAVWEDVTGKRWRVQ